VVGRVFGVFENADAVWAESLPRSHAKSSGTRVPTMITLVLADGERFEGVGAATRK
jgi:hypothetical protein